ncbi:MAG: DUF58 domain-containing protein, partial [Alphaproteobacteria bacterium]
MSRASGPAAGAGPGGPADPREILDKVRHIEIRTQRLARETLAGQYHSVFKGRGMDFEEVREYVPGDEIRAIDWNVTARTGRPFVKKFREERELTIALLVDLSASGGFGSGEQSKRELAAEVAAVLAFSAIRNADKVALIVFTDEVEHYVPPGKGRAHVLRVVRDILYFRPRRRGTDVARAIEFATRVLHRRSIAFLVSDFLVPLDDPNLRRALEIGSRRHDLVGVCVSDPRERELPDVGRVALEDAESGDLVEIDTSDPAVRDAWTRAAAERRTTLLHRLRGSGLDTLELDTAVSYMPALLRFFRQRAARQR